ncbi:MAG: 50S ribosomal protein L4 [Lentisphaerae bacterium]|nr:50S ribosomal protein L4 [Lentisphaerota bacterium]
MATTLPVLDIQGGAAAAVDVNDAWLEREKGAQAVKDSVVAHLAQRRSGTASTKNRAAVAGSSAKPYRQKGTGRARAGSRKSPVWRGGGVVFGPLPRSYSKHVNRKVQRLALRRAFTERVDAGDVIVVNEVAIDDAKTRRMVEFLERIGAGQDALVLVDELSPSVATAARNLPCVHVMKAASVNAYLLLQFRKIVFSRAGLEAFGKRLVTVKEGK